MNTATTTHTIRVHVDPTNPGQFFACCGLLELADRLWENTAGWFDQGWFCITPITAPPKQCALPALIDALCRCPLEQLNSKDDFSSPIRLGAPFGIDLDWWLDDRSGGNRLKVWAGSMRPVRIARAMRAALQRDELRTDHLLDHGMVVFDPDEPDKKVEPYYFDGRRGNNAQSRDIGFAPDAIQMTTAAFPAVEFLCLVGLQRIRPAPTDQPRVFEYCTWSKPSLPEVVAAYACGAISHVDSCRYRFENSFRTDQKKHKAFSPATPAGAHR